MADKCEVKQNEHHIRIKVGCMEIYAESNDMHDLITISHADNSPLRFDERKIVDIANGKVFCLGGETVNEETIVDLTEGIAVRRRVQTLLEQTND